MLRKNKKYPHRMSQSLISFLIMAIFLIPNYANAGIISSFTEKVKSIFLGNNESEEEGEKTSQTISLPKASISIEDSTDTQEISENTTALSVKGGALRFSSEEIDYPLDDTINVYEVKKGDTLLTVAKLFNVSKNTIIWANDLKSERISPGDTLVILPITGIKYTTKKGDTVNSIAKRYKADEEDIAKYNGIAIDSKLDKGVVIIIPEGELSAPDATKSKNPKTGKILERYTKSSPDGFLIRPIVGGRKTQGIHGHNGIDLGSSVGTPVLASATGRVIIAKSSGYNGGYGQMIVIAHENGIQTVYAHLSAVSVSVGQSVSQGEIIGALGNTGKSTGPHLHFEVRGAKNPF